VNEIVFDLTAHRTLHSTVVNYVSVVNEIVFDLTDLPYEDFPQSVVSVVNEIVFDLTYCCGQSGSRP